MATGSSGLQNLFSINTASDGFGDLPRGCPGGLTPTRSLTRGLRGEALSIVVGVDVVLSTHAIASYIR